MTNVFYVYIYLDPRKNGNFKYEDYQFDYEPFYIGKGKDQRYKSRSCISKTGKGYLNNKIKKLQKNNLKPIIKKIKENLLESEAFELEKLMIKLIGRKDHKKGPLLNATDGGEGPSGKILSTTSKEKISKSKTGKKTGSRSNETKNKISLAKKGKGFSDEHKRNLSKSRKTRITSTTTREKMRKSMLGKNCDRRKYCLINKENNMFFTDNLHIFCIEHNISKSNLHKVLNNKIKFANNFRVIRLFETGEKNVETSIVNL